MPDVMQFDGLDCEAATAVVAATRAEATKRGLSISAAIVDAGGHLLAFARMDGALLVSAQVALDKAYTARMFHQPTAGMAAAMAPGAPLFGLATDRLLPLGGGAPLIAGGDIVGAVGVAGGPEAEDAALAAFATDFLTQHQGDQ